MSKIYNSVPQEDPVTTQPCHQVTRERTKSEIHQEIIDTSCGIGSWRPDWLQSLATPRAFLVNFALVGVIQGFSGAYLVGSMTTLEKR